MDYNIAYRLHDPGVGPVGPIDCVKGEVSMSQQVLGRHYTVRFARFLQGWAILSFLAFIGLILYFIFVSRGADVRIRANNLLGVIG
jgi:hypothetical protein